MPALRVASEPPLYLDACATTPVVPEALQAMAEAQQHAWANPSSLHGFGLAAAESLERSRQRLAQLLGTAAPSLLFCSGASESVHLALLGMAASCDTPGRVVISAVEHPAVVAAAQQLQRQGWSLATVPVDACGLVQLDRLEALLQPPTRLVSVIWGQSEVGAVQAIAAIGARCRAAGVLFHTDAVQWAPHHPIDFDQLPVDLLTLTAHKLGGPRGIGALLLRPELRDRLRPLFNGGGQEGGLRAGTEPVVLAAGFAAALEKASAGFGPAGSHRLAPLRDQLLNALLALPGLRLSGPEPSSQQRLPHHLSLVAQRANGEPISGRRLVHQLWRQGVAASSGSACSGASATPAPSPVLLAMGYEPTLAAAGLRLSLGPWCEPQQLLRVPQALEHALEACAE